MKQLVTYQRLVGQESSYYVLLEGYDYPFAETISYLSKTCWSGIIISMDSHNPPTEHNMMIPDQQVFDK
jgi:hypothetical protein